SLYYFTRHLGIGFQGASLPHVNNYLDLDPTYKDAYGVPLLRMTYNFTDQDRKLHSFLSEKATEFVKEMGADIVTEGEELGDYDIVPYQTTHNTGGTPMGDDPALSTVNNFLQMWESENTFV